MIKKHYAHKMVQEALGYLVLVLLGGLLSCQNAPHKVEQHSLQGNQNTPLLANDKMPIKGDESTSENKKVLLVQYQWRPGEITIKCDREMALAKEKILHIETYNYNKKEDPNDLSPLLKFEALMTDMMEALTPITFLMYVSPDETIRKEAQDCKSKNDQFIIEIQTNKKLYRTIAASKTKTQIEKRLKEETLLEFEENGLKFSDKIISQVQALNKELAELKTQFEANLNNDTTFVTLSKDQLNGVPISVISRFKTNKEGSDFIDIPIKAPNVTDIIRYASSNSTRQKVLTAFHSLQGKENTPILEKALLNRQKTAQLLGYSNWVDFKTHRKMAKSAKNVEIFQNNISKSLRGAHQKGLKKLLDFKRTIDPQAQQIELWDIFYLEELIRRKEFSLDSEKIKEYFPTPHVIKSVFDIYGKLLGIKVRKVENAEVWFTGVELYEILDSEKADVLGFFYLDLQPREGKYNHAALFSLRNGYLNQKSERIKPIAAMVANLSAGSGGKLGLLTHREVQTFFHEFGHLLHVTLSQSPFASLSGANVKWDFVEAPSQMFEQWVWDPECLSILSSHYERPQEKLPSELIKKMISARFFNAPYTYTRQMLLGKYDIAIHKQSGTVDSIAVFNRLFKEIMEINPIPNHAFPASFGHLMGGYDAGYYGYLWSEVYAWDMFSKFKKEGLQNQKVGKEYRAQILEKGNTEEPIELIKKFLGRPPSNASFDQLINEISNK